MITGLRCLKKNPQNKNKTIPIIIHFIHAQSIKNPRKKSCEYAMCDIDFFLRISIYHIPI